MSRQSLSIAEFNMLNGFDGHGRRVRNDKEHRQQVALFDWAGHAKAAIPELALLFAIPNGGHRHLATAARLKAEGVRAGVLDVVLPVARLPYIGLWIEMKVEPNKPTKEQLWWARELSAAGHKCGLAYDWHQARNMIVEYLAGRPFDGGFVL